jgi:hypothetical protein
MQNNLGWDLASTSCGAGLTISTILSNYQTPLLLKRMTGSYVVPSQLTF